MLKAIGLYVHSIETKHVDFIKDLPRCGLTNSLRHATEQREHLEKLTGMQGEIFIVEEFLEKEAIPFCKIKDIEENEKKYYTLENNRGQVVKRIEDAGNIVLSFQEQYKMTRVYEVERALDRIDEYGLKEFEPKENTITIRLTKLEER